MSRREMRAGFEIDPGDLGEPSSRIQAEERKQERPFREDEAPSASDSGMRAGKEFDLPGGSEDYAPAPVAPTGDQSLDIPDWEDGSSEEIPQGSVWTSPVLWILLLITAFGGLQAWYFITGLYSQNMFTGIMASLVMVVLAALVLISLLRELRSVLLLRRADERRLEIRRIIASGTAEQALALCRIMATESHMTGHRRFDVFLHKVRDHHTAAEIFLLYEDELIREQDEMARRIIVRRSRENGLVVALSPLAWLDMLFTLARSLRMIREISEVYGLRCGIWGRMRLYRRVARNMIFIGMADLATDAVADVLGAGMAGKISAALGQGIAAGIYSTRLGYMTVKAVRPLEMGQRIMTLAQLRRALLLEGRLAELIRGDGDKDRVRS